MTAPAPTLAAVRAGRKDAIPSAAESWPCPACHTGRTFYTSGLYGQTEERCACGYAAVITGRQAPEAETARPRGVADPAARVCPIPPVPCGCGCGQLSHARFDKAARYWRPPNKLASPACLSAWRAKLNRERVAAKALPVPAVPAVPAAPPVRRGRRKMLPVVYWCACGCGALCAPSRYRSRPVRFASDACRYRVASERGKAQMAREMAALREDAA